MTDDQTFELALEESLQLLAAGVSLKECLRRFPHYAAELEPLLNAAQAARTGLLADQPIPKPNLARGKWRFLGAARAQPARPFWLLNPRWVGGLLVLLLVVAIGTGVASANALPGDALYSVKRGLESVRLALTFDPEARTRLRDEQAARRRAEAQTVLNLGREAQIEFEGVVEVVQPDELQVFGLRVLTSRAHEFRVADVVRVLAHTSPDALVADQIVLLSRPTPVPTRAATAVARPSTTPTRLVATTTTAPTETRLPPTATATPTTSRPTPITPTVTRPMPSATRRPTETETHPTDTPTTLRFTDTLTLEATATQFRPTPTVTLSGRP